MRGTGAALDHVSVKEAVLPFDRFPGVDTLLGPEMRSTGEVMGVDTGSGWPSPRARWPRGPAARHRHRVLSLADRDKPAGLEVAGFDVLGFSIAATLGTPGNLRAEGLAVDTLVAKVGEEGVASDAVVSSPRARCSWWSTRRVASAACRRPPHPHGGGGLQGAVPHHPGGRPAAAAGMAETRSHPLKVRPFQDLHPGGKHATTSAEARRFGISPPRSESWGCRSRC